MMERMVEVMTPRELTSFLQSIMDKLYYLFIDRNASFPIEKMLVRVPECLGGEGDEEDEEEEEEEDTLGDDEEKKAPREPMDALFMRMCADMAFALVDVMNDIQATHLVRVVMLVLGGCPKQILTNKRNRENNLVAFAPEAYAGNAAFAAMRKTWTDAVVAADLRKLVKSTAFSVALQTLLRVLASAGTPETEAELVGLLDAVLCWQKKGEEEEEEDETQRKRTVYIQVGWLAHHAMCV